MKISDILELKSIRINYISENKNDLLSEIMNLAKVSNNIMDFEIVKSELFEREEVMSTGIGKGIALPHCKSAHIGSMTAALIINSEAMDYDSLDKLPVRLIFLLLSRSDNVGAHLKMLSRVSRLVNNDSLKNSLLEAEDPEDAYEIIKKFDAEYKN
jgi:mannitol/fructose-specific phosphotransferase system IIA component (Ntr-type)